MLCTSLFPSPVGELCFSIKTKSIKASKGYCFRPLSGSYVSQLLVKCALRKDYAQVSVPCRGAMFLNNTVMMIRDCNARFRPLSGSYVSQSAPSSVSVSASRFPSPVGELCFSIPSLQSRFQSKLYQGIAWEKYFYENITI